MGDPRNRRRGPHGRGSCISRGPPSRGIAVTTLHLPADRIPDDNRLRDHILSDYFCERVAVPRRDEGGWTIDVFAAPSADFYIDPRLSESLEWWGRSADVTDIPDERHDDFGWLLSLNDAWTAYAWSE